MNAQALQRYSAAKPAAIIASMLRVLFPDARSALDLTPGRGTFWDGTAHVEVTASEADFRCLPCADGGRAGIMARRFGTYRNGDLERAVRAGCREAMRVGRLGCIVKVTDHTHGQTFTWQTGWVTDELGAPYDVVHQVRARNLEDGRWRGAYSARSNGSVYLAFRHGDQRHRARGAGT